jgi:hypothetical protein
MITSKVLLRQYLQEDCRANLGRDSISTLQLWAKLLYGSESAYAFRFLKVLRYYEYSINCMGDGIFCHIVKFFLQWRWRRLMFKYNLNIQPNRIGPGFRMPHILGGGDCYKL